MFAADANHAGVVTLLLKRGADGTKTTTPASRWDDTWYTALDMARLKAVSDPGFAETLAVLRLQCCSTCGVTSAGLSAATPGVEQRLKRCASCPAHGSGAHYCGKDCQRADWASRHRAECAEARRARQAAGAEV